MYRKRKPWVSAARTSILFKMSDVRNVGKPILIRVMVGAWGSLNESILVTCSSENQDWWGPGAVSQPDSGEGPTGALLEARRSVTLDLAVNPAAPPVSASGGSPRSGVAHNSRSYDA